jgi:hypothetical protein
MPKQSRQEKALKSDDESNTAGNTKKKRKTVKTSSSLSDADLPPVEPMTHHERNGSGTDTEPVFQPEDLDLVLPSKALGNESTMRTSEGNHRENPISNRGSCTVVRF